MSNEKTVTKRCKACEEPFKVTGTAGERSKRFCPSCTRERHVASQRESKRRRAQVLAEERVTVFPVAIRTQQEVAELLGISQQEVDKIEQSALKKLRNHPLMKEIREEWLSRD